MASGNGYGLCLARYARCLSEWEVYFASRRRFRAGFSICSGFGRFRRQTSTRQYAQQYFAFRLVTAPRVPLGPLLQREFIHVRESAGNGVPSVGWRGEISCTGAPARSHLSHSQRREGRAVRSSRFAGAAFMIAMLDGEFNRFQHRQSKDRIA
jgi:hypothetical protein